jgi:hypothetical protein
MEKDITVHHHDHELETQEQTDATRSPSPGYIAGSKEEKDLLRKIDWHLIPILWAMYVFNYLDRTNIGVCEIIYSLWHQLTLDRTQK